MERIVFEDCTTVTREGDGVRLQIDTVLTQVTHGVRTRYLLTVEFTNWDSEDTAFWTDSMLSYRLFPTAAAATRQAVREHDLAVEQIHELATAVEGGLRE